MLSRRLIALVVLSAGFLDGGPSVAADRAPRSPIKSDEEIVFYPTSGSLDVKEKAWDLPVHGLIFEPETDSVKRALLVRILKAGLPGEMSTAEAQTFDRRVRLFLVDGERGKKISVRIDSRVCAVGESGPDGDFHGSLRFSAADAEELARGQKTPNPWLSFQAVTQPSDERKFVGRVQLLAPTGLSVVSDIDDTIKVTQVRNRKAMLVNTFLRPFKPVPGMAVLYRKLAEGGAAFHYVSASPWQLYPPLTDFRVEAGFPDGTFQLKSIHFTNSTALELLSSPEAFKRPVIEGLLARYPQRRFLLVGDTGEQDPEIYGRLARQHEKQIVAVFLRNITGETADNSRMKKALGSLPSSRWALFCRPEDLSGRADGILREEAGKR